MVPLDSPEFRALLEAVREQFAPLNGLFSDFDKSKKFFMLAVVGDDAEAYAAATSALTAFSTTMSLNLQKHLTELRAKHKPPPQLPGSDN